MIHVEELTKYYGDLCAVDHVDLNVEKGEILGLLGPNGAGKTTTLRILTGFMKPTSGKVRVKEYNNEEHPLEIRKILGYLPESAPLYHDMLVFDYLNYIAAIREIESNKKQARIREMADLCGLNEVMHKPIGELSKGYKQRVGLAHSMISDPEILIFDEPTSGLDPNQIVEIREIIKKIGKEKTIILSTHILSEAEATCDRIAIINQGKIVADGDIAGLMKAAKGKNIINLSLHNADPEIVQNELGTLDGVESVQSYTIDEGVLKVKITCKSSTDLRGSIYEKIKQTDWILLEFYQETQSLEKIFQKLTKEE